MYNTKNNITNGFKISSIGSAMAMAMETGAYFNGKINAARPIQEKTQEVVFPSLGNTKVIINENSKTL